MTTQPEALRIADGLEEYPVTYSLYAAAELRRLYEVNQELLVALKGLSDYLIDTATCNSDTEIASMAHKIIAKATGEQA